MSIEQAKIQQGIAEWERTLVSDFLQGPSANPNWRTNHVFAEAYQQGLMPKGNKFAFAREVAEILSFAQQGGQSVESMKELNLETVARETGRTPERIREVRDFMVQAQFFPQK